MCEFRYAVPERWKVERSMGILSEVELVLLKLVAFHQQLIQN